MTKAQKQARMKEIVAKMKELYPDAACALQWGEEPWRLLIMGMLSAQCTDARVNVVCHDLFAVYPTPKALAEAPIESIEDLIRSCGLYHTKAKNAKAACALLVEEYDGVLPDTMEELLRFPGVGRKVGNLLLGDIYRKGGIVADTHCIRICGRFGMYPETEKDPLRVERAMEVLIDREEQSDFCHRIVQFGRDTCSARAPQCPTCPIKELCEHGKNNI